MTATNNYDARLAELGLTLPVPAVPIANFVPCVQVGNTLYVSGQVPRENGQLAFVGKVGRDLGVEQGQAAARNCVLAILSLVNAHLGTLNRVRRVAMLQCFVNAVPEFGDHPKVANGASDLLVALFGDAGRHARFALGAGSLPGNVAVEIAAVIEVE